MQKYGLSKIRILMILVTVSIVTRYTIWNKKQYPLLVEKQVELPVTEGQESLRIASLHGEAVITEPVLLDLLKTPVMERLRGINQGGVCHFAEPKTPPFNRYEHCVDVFLVLRRYGATLEEQIAGLLHDASHTVFSHVGDFVFKNNDAKESYQDRIHEWFLKEYGIDKVLAKHGYSIEEVLHKCGSFPLLEQDLPDLCADRIQYNYHTGFIDGLITADEVRQGYQHLKYENGIWFFDNPEDAARLARISLHETTHFWGAAWNLLIYEWTAQAIRRAVNLGLITAEHIHYDMQDEQMWNTLLSFDDPMIQYLMHRVKNYKEQFTLVSEEEFKTIHNDASVLSQNMNYKFRGIDPWVKTEQGLQRLTSLDKEYAQVYTATKEQAKKGWFIVYNTITEKDSHEGRLFAQAESIIHEQEGALEKTCSRIT